MADSFESMESAADTLMHKGPLTPAQVEATIAELHSPAFDDDMGHFARMEELIRDDPELRISGEDEGYMKILREMDAAKRLESEEK